MFNRKVKLPTTLEGFDALVAKVVKKFKLADPHHAAAIISDSIQRLPRDAAHTTLNYLGHTVIKNIAHFIAKHKTELMQHESQLKQLQALLESDPSDVESRDKLQQAANGGSELAKEILLKFENPEALLTN